MITRLSHFLGHPGLMGGCIGSLLLSRLGTCLQSGGSDAFELVAKSGAAELTGGFNFRIMDSRSTPNVSGLPAWSLCFGTGPISGTPGNCPGESLGPGTFGFPQTARGTSFRCCGGPVART